MKPIVVQLREESRPRATTNKRERDNTCARKRKRMGKSVREERSVSARAGKHASQPGKQVNEWTNERTNGRRGSGVLPSYIRFPRRCHHRSRHSRFNRISEETSDVKKNNENRPAPSSWGLRRPRAYASTFEPNLQINIRATIPTLLLILLGYPSTYGHHHHHQWYRNNQTIYAISCLLRCMLVRLFH